MLKIFIADDHKILRQGLKRIIEEVPDYRVVGEIGDGYQIMPAIQQTKPHLLILDISMPNVRGIEAIKKIRRIDRRLKILMLTMHKNEQYAYECLASGASGYILKDDADTELLAAIDSVRKGDVYVSSSFASDVIKSLLRQKKSATGAKPLDALTPRQREILKLIAEGCSNKKIAAMLAISVRTVEHHRLQIMKTVSASNITALIKYAAQIGLITLH